MMWNIIIKMYLCLWWQRWFFCSHY